MKKTKITKTINSRPVKDSQWNRMRRKQNRVIKKGGSGSQRLGIQYRPSGAEADSADEWMRGSRVPRVKRKEIM